MEFEEKYPPKFSCYICGYSNYHPLNVAHHIVQCKWDKTYVNNY